MAETVINVNGKQCDLSKALPLVLGDYRKLIKSGIDMNMLGKDMLQQIDFLQYILIKANSEITANDVDSMTTESFKHASEVITKLSVTKDSGPLDAG